MRSSFAAFLTVSLTGAFSALAIPAEIMKRTTGTATFYDVGLGACGVVSEPSDFVTAISLPYYDGGINCFKTVTITANGKTTNATVVDECPECGTGSMDFSTGLFEFFAPLDAGVVDITWTFV